MLNNVVLDVFIGLIFVFLLYSLLATILQELIAARFGLRARMLQKALRRMLEDNVSEVSGNGVVNWQKEVAEDLDHFFKPFGRNNSYRLLRKFYDHPSIKYLGEGRLFKKPSYLHAHNFSQTIIHLLRGEEYDGRTQNESELIRRHINENTLEINPQTLKQLKSLFADARQDAFIFKHKIEDWFEETMERTTGWYRKQTQLILITIDFILAIAFNVDAIAITKILIKDKKAREQLVELAVNRQKEYGDILDTVKTITVSRIPIAPIDTSANGPADTARLDTITTLTIRNKLLDSLNSDLQKDALAVQGILGLRGIMIKLDTVACVTAVSNLDSLIKENPANIDSLTKARKKSYEQCMSKLKEKSSYQKNIFLMIIGWLITALAISLGAPFWFDLLTKFVKFRSTGPKVNNMSAVDRISTSPAGNPVKDNNNLDIRG